MREEERANALKIQAELNALQQQINPHFLYNTLEMINLNLLKYGDFSTSKVIGNLSKIFRYSISRANETVALGDEIEKHKKITSLFGIYVFPEDLNLYGILTKNLLNRKTLKLILQPIMENCFFHAFDNKSEKLRYKN
ncbi:MAG: histidine kinase [Clostridiales bacterium]|nr:MAG: histidine kinase [Clostridiales bacterium]